MTSMHLIMSEEDPNLSERMSNQSPSPKNLMKKFHSQHTNQMLKFNNAKMHTEAKDIEPDFEHEEDDEIDKDQLDEIAE